MTTIEALFDLYEALGGDVDSISTLETIPELLEEISEIAGSTIELPGVTASDNGNVLTVVDGKWAKAEASTPTSTSESFSAKGLTGTIKTYGNVSEIKVNTTSGTITSGNGMISSSVSVPENLLNQEITLYHDGASIGYFQLINMGSTGTTVYVSVDETEATSAKPVYTNLITL